MGRFLNSEPQEIKSGRKRSSESVRKYREDLKKFDSFQAAVIKAAKKVDRGVAYKSAINDREIDGLTVTAHNFRFKVCDEKEFLLLEYIGDGHCAENPSSVFQFPKALYILISRRAKCLEIKESADGKISLNLKQ